MQSPAVYLYSPVKFLALTILVATLFLSHTPIASAFPVVESAPSTVQNEVGKWLFSADSSSEFSPTVNHLTTDQNDLQLISIVSLILSILPFGLAALSWFFLKRNDE